MRFSGRPKSGIRIFYGFDRLPAEDEPVGGGIIKFQRMHRVFPNSPRRFNVLYLGSSTMPPDARELVDIARDKEAQIVWNQNGVAYPAWHGPGWERANAPMADVLHLAHHVFYQSAFCKLTADHFLGEREGPWEILYNAVDTDFFTPAESDPDPDALTLVLGGDQFQPYRFEVAVRAVAALARRRPDARLHVTGRLRWAPEDEAARQAHTLMDRLGVRERVRFLGPYSQREAPAILRRGHVLLHTKVNDPCPSIVIEALSCGLPVVYSATGGVPELVGEDAGIGVPSATTWERDVPPDPDDLAQAVVAVSERLPERSEAARRRAVERFDLRPWIERHREVFEKLLQ
jgi:glycosyltransferase involved in cell wall biosynthesis